MGSFGSAATMRAGAPSVFQISWNSTPSSGSARLDRHRAVRQHDGDAVRGVAGDDPAGDGHAWVTIGPPLRATISGQSAGMISGVGDS